MHPSLAIGLIRIENILYLQASWQSYLSLAGSHLGWSKFHDCQIRIDPI